MEVRTGADILTVKEEYGLSYQQFADIAGMHWNTLWCLAHNRRRMSNLTRIRLTQVARELAENPPVQRERQEVCAQRAPHR